MTNNQVVNTQLVTAIGKVAAPTAQGTGTAVVHTQLVTAKGKGGNSQT